ncbi:DUF4394 domain-containing protein [Umezawaea sp.]|uniref:DUF4394 domain-containing protein n=1 Tax=Umezawaea sp. TaxID=1955258 RepID=UPI002ED21F61
MHARIKKGLTAAAVAVSVVAAVVVGSPGSSSAAVPSLRAYGISPDGRVMATYTTDRPDRLDWVKEIVGFVGDDAAIGLDYRVQDGLLYVVGNKGGVYTVKFTPEPVLTKVSQLSVALYGTTFGVDFNPAADRLRVISDNGQNLRHNLATHTTDEDGNLNTPPSPATTKGVTAAAYTNNDLNPDSATTLFDIGTILDQVVIQSPPNLGSLVPTGSLTVDAGLKAGFDIFSVLNGGKAASVLGFASLTAPNGSTSLYSVNLLNGEATAIGRHPFAFPDLAISLTGS